jgi:ribosome-associated toxin RatA of RatAB toxin-antitoxin module
LTRYDVTDEAIIDASPKIVYNAIIEVYDGKTDWWKPYLSSKIIKGNSSCEIGSIFKVTVHGISPITFVTKTAEFRKNEMIRVNYIGGAFSGEGLWRFEKLGSKTRVVFRWQTNPASLLLRIVAPLYPVAKSHSSVMKKGFKSLGEYLEKNH